MADRSAANMPCGGDFAERSGYRNAGEPCVGRRGGVNLPLKDNVALTGTICHRKAPALRKADRSDDT